MLSGRPVDGVRRKRRCRNGSEMRETLPLWRGDEGVDAVRKACSRGAVKKEMLQRQGNAENAAVVERGGGGRKEWKRKRRGRG